MPVPRVSWTFMLQVFLIFAFGVELVNANLFGDTFNSFKSVTNIVNVAAPVISTLGLGMFTGGGSLLGSLVSGPITSLFGSIFGEAEVPEEKTWLENWLHEYEEWLGMLVFVLILLFAVKYVMKAYGCQSSPFNLLMGTGNGTAKGSSPSPAATNQSPPSAQVTATTSVATTCIVDHSQTGEERSASAAKVERMGADSGRAEEGKAQRFGERMDVNATLTTFNKKITAASNTATKTANDEGLAFTAVKRRGRADRSLDIDDVVQGGLLTNNIQNATDYNNTSLEASRARLRTSTAANQRARILAINNIEQNTIATLGDARESRKNFQLDEKSKRAKGNAERRQREAEILEAAKSPAQKLEEAAEKRRLKREERAEDRRARAEDRRMQREEEEQEGIQRRDAEYRRDKRDRERDQKDEMYRRQKDERRRKQDQHDILMKPSKPDPMQTLMDNLCKMSQAKTMTDAMKEFMTPPTVPTIPAAPVTTPGRRRHASRIPNTPRRGESNVNEARRHPAQSPSHNEAADDLSDDMSDEGRECEGKPSPQTMNECTTEGK